MEFIFKLITICVFLSTICDFSLAQEKLKFCDVKAKNELCYKVKSGGSLECSPADDSLNCTIQLLNGQANVATFTAEQLLVYGKSLNSTYKVIGSARNINKPNATFLYETVAIVRKSFEGGLKQLRNAKYCHPGFQFQSTLSKRVLTDFEHAIITPVCASGDSYATEDEIKSLASFFGSSCRPGKWVETNDTLDKQLKQNYHTLCELCDDKYKCEYKDEKNPQHDALRCLTKLDGDVTYVLLDYARSYFGLNSRFSQHDSKSYQFLCPDGSKQPLDTGKPCTWIRQPWPAIITKPELEDQLMHTLLDDRNSEDYRTLIMGVENQLHEVENRTSIIQYVETGRKFPNDDSDKCRPYMRWCTISTEEKDKCDWLSVAVKTAGINPQLKCVLGTDTLDCFKLIKNNKADLISIDSNYGYIARKNYGLEPVYYQEVTERSEVIAVIKNDDVSRYTKFGDLRGKNVCFPEYGGIAWIATAVLGQHNKTFLRSSYNKTCDFGRDISNYFMNGCVPGARDKNHGVTEGTNSDNLCSLCSGNELSKVAATCKADYTNKYYGDLGALLCLKEASGDIAFVEKTSVLGSPDEQAYRVLCRNNSLAINPGFDVDEDCALVSVIDSETMTRKKDANRNEFELFIDNLNLLFGNQFNIDNIVMKMFAPFNGHQDVLFKTHTTGFDDTNNPNNQYAKNYDRIFKIVEECNSGNIKLISLYTLIISLIFVYINY